MADPLAPTSGEHCSACGKGSLWRSFYVLSPDGLGRRYCPECYGTGAGLPPKRTDDPQHTREGELAHRLAAGPTKAIKELLIRAELTEAKLARCVQLLRDVTAPAPAGQRYPLGWLVERNALIADTPAPVEPPKGPWREVPPTPPGSVPPDPDHFAEPVDPPKAKESGFIPEQHDKWRRDVLLARGWLPPDEVAARIQKARYEALGACLDECETECEVSADRGWSEQWSCGVHGVTFRGKKRPNLCPAGNEVRRIGEAIQALKSGGA